MLLNNALINQCFGATGLQRLLIYVCLHLGPEEDEFSFCWHSCLRVCSFQLGLEQMSSSCTQCYRSFFYSAVSCCLAFSWDAKYTHTKSVWSVQHGIEITNKPKKRDLHPTAWKTDDVRTVFEHQDRCVKARSIHHLQREHTVISAS